MATDDLGYTASEAGVNFWSRARFRVGKIRLKAHEAYDKDHWGERVTRLMSCSIPARTTRGSCALE